MRNEIILNDGWYFTDRTEAPLPSESAELWEKVTLPHTWNSEDGQDGGADYKRTECRYYTELDLPSVKKNKRYYLRFAAAQYDCRVILNGEELGRHKGGYSAFVFEVTGRLRRGLNQLLVSVSNAPVTDIYPQMADFTFYGGLHRAVSLMILPKTHFDVEYYAGSGITVDADVVGESARLRICAFVKNAEKGDTVRYTVLNAKGEVTLEAYRSACESAVEITLEKVHLWMGVEDPYLYEVRAEIIRKNEVLDGVSTSYGFKSFSVDPEKGFILNGRAYPLKGVSRHQDKLGKGNALGLQDHELDMELIREVGANAVRLAHYQQSDEVYGLCDRYGFIVWAEIPFISKMSDDPTAHENAVLQMRELIVQNYNHTSICLLGISNEITIGGSSETLVNNLRELNALCHELAPGRLTVMAQVSPLPIEDEQNLITDTVAYNHYFGWYGGELSDNEKWLDKFHSSHPKRPIGISEYGCEGIISYHSDAPKAGDYSEEYQALYHEHMLKVFEKRPYIFGTYVWNMFDFGCDARDEGGVKGRNNKGLVSFDRRIKKDAFYLYKSYWNDASIAPVVHICGKRYAKRAEKSIDVKVYSNAPTVTLFVNGERFAERTADRVFLFENVPLDDGLNSVLAVMGATDGKSSASALMGVTDGKSSVSAITGAIENQKLLDRALFELVKEKPDEYTLKVDEGEEGVTNWFEGKEPLKAETLTFDSGYFSVRDTLRQILENEEAGTVLINAFSSFSGMRLKKSMLMMMAEQTPEAMFKSGLGQLPKDTDAMGLLAILNAELQKIPKR